MSAAPTLDRSFSRRGTEDWYCPFCQRARRIVEHFDATDCSMLFVCPVCSHILGRLESVTLEQLRRST